MMRYWEYTWLIRNKKQGGSKMRRKYSIKRNPDEEVANAVEKAVKENDGYCPCRLTKNKDTRCCCREFREQQENGLCHCGLYEKEFIEEEY